MPYEFFFSYTRGNNDAFLMRFFEDLSDEVRIRRGLPRGAAVGFLDQNDIELGTSWDPTISQALQASKVLVSVYSPGYFSSAYCGKEWEIFYRRVALHQNQIGANATLPSSIKPILWYPFEISNVNARVQALQFMRGDPASALNAKGLLYVLKQIAEHRTEYNDFISDLAVEITDTADKFPLPELNPFPLLADVPSAWQSAPANPATNQAATKIAVTSPKHVRFVFIAADPNEFGAVRPPDPYLDRGAGDWKPFFPDQATIGPFVQHIVSDKELGFTSDELQFSSDLVKEIQQAWDDRKIVVILVDGWSVDWRKSYQDILKEFDKQNFFNCTVLVPWNTQDPLIDQQGNTILQTLKDTFYFRQLPGNSIFYRDNIRDADELRNALRDVLTRIRAEIRKRAEITRPIPLEITKPIIAGPGMPSPSR